VLAGSRLVLHDISGARLQRAYRFAAKLNAANGNPVMLAQSTDPAEALTGADFVIASAEHGRFHYWRQDYEIPLRHGATQVNGENGGPGAVFHSLRSIKNTLSICADIEKHCPDAFLICRRIGAGGPVYKWEFEKRGKLVTVSVSGSLIFTDPTFTQRAALDGLGLAFLFEEHVADHVARGALVRVLEDWCPPFDGSFLYHPSRRHQPPALQALVNALRL